MLRKCIECNSEVEQEGTRCQFCGADTLKSNPEEKVSVVCYLHYNGSFSEIIEQYEDDNLTKEQLTNLYHRLYEVGFSATFEGNKLVKLEVI